MRAVVLTSPQGAMEVRDIERPRPGAGEVLMEVAACGVCHSDLHVIKGEVAFPTPCVLGHEVSGVVAELGAGVTGLSVGQPVASSFIIPCGTCRHCVRGLEDLCESFFNYNRLRGVLYDGKTRLYNRDGSPLWMYSMGGLSEFCVVPATDVFPLPSGVDLREASVLGCSVFTSVGAVRNVARVTPGESVAVVAVGGIGLNLIQVARAFGAREVVAIDLADDKLDLARRLGATVTINASSVDAVEAVREVTGGKGVDVAFEALGSPATVETAIDVLDDGGRAVLVGIAPVGSRATFDITRVVRRKIRILGSYGARARTDMPLALDLVARGLVQVGDLITDRFPLEETARAYEALDNRRVVGRALIEM